MDLFLTPKKPYKKRRLNISPKERERILDDLNTSIVELRNKLSTANHNDQLGIESQLHTKILEFIHYNRPDIKLSQRLELSLQDFIGLSSRFGGESEPHEDDLSYLDEYELRTLDNSAEVEQTAQNLTEELTKKLAEELAEELDESKKGTKLMLRL